MIKRVVVASTVNGKRLGTPAPSGRYFEHQLGTTQHSALRIDLTLKVRSCDDIKASSKQPAFVDFFWSAQPFQLTLGDVRFCVLNIENLKSSKSRRDTFHGDNFCSKLHSKNHFPKMFVSTFVRTYDSLIIYSHSQTLLA